MSGAGDDPDTHLALNENGRDKNHPHYFDWWFKEWLGGSKPTEAPTQIARFLKQSGFVEPS